MGWKLEQESDGQWRWAIFQSAYGAAGGHEATREAAIVEMVIAEAAIYEHPIPPSVREMMRANPEKVAADYESSGDT